MCNIATLSFSYIIIFGFYGSLKCSFYVYAIWKKHVPRTVTRRPFHNSRLDVYLGSGSVSFSL